MEVSYLNSQQSLLIDQLLIKKYGFQLSVLMEHAGQSAAHCLHYINSDGKFKNVLILVGPGNNGGDGIIFFKGIVASRILSHMNYNVQILRFRDPTVQFFINLYNLAKANQVIIKSFQNQFNTQNQNFKYSFINYINSFHVIIDAIFGFSIKLPLKSPYSIVIQLLSKVNKPILSIDIPSGWIPDDQNCQKFFTPTYLISMTLPKICSKSFKSNHYLGCRFIPKQMQKQLNLKIPEFPGSSTFMKI